MTCIIVEDHAEMLHSIADYLESEGFEVVGRTASAVEAVELLRTLQPDVAILDYRLPESSGIEIARAIAVASPRTSAILFSGDVTRAVVEEALTAGARGVVLKDSPPTTLVRAISVVLAGRRFVDPRLRRRS